MSSGEIFIVQNRFTHVFKVKKSTFSALELLYKRAILDYFDYKTILMQILATTSKNIKNNNLTLRPVCI